MLTAWPCCIEENTDDTELAYPIEDDDCKTCSPFFNCEGCSSIAEWQIIITPTHFNCSTHNYASYLQKFVAQVDSEIWLPPKVVG